MAALAPGAVAAGCRGDGEPPEGELTGEQAGGGACEAGRGGAGGPAPEHAAGRRAGGGVQQAGDAGQRGRLGARVWGGGSGTIRQWQDEMLEARGDEQAERMEKNSIRLRSSLGPGQVGVSRVLKRFLASCFYPEPFL